MKIAQPLDIAEMVYDGFGNRQFRNEKEVFKFRVSLRLTKQKVFGSTVNENEAITNLRFAECVD